MRAPRLGAVKTRLAADLGPEVALAAYCHLVARTLNAINHFDSVELRVTPDDAVGDVLSSTQKHWRLERQGEGSLGDRLDRAITAAFSRGSKRVVVIGTDCPTITAQDIKDAFIALDSADLVLGPATDGGYWLIGMRRPWLALFADITWGSSEVLKQTLHRARGADLEVACLRELNDIDTAADWERYQNGNSFSR